MAGESGERGKGVVSEGKRERKRRTKEGGVRGGQGRQKIAKRRCWKRALKRRNGY